MSAATNRRQAVLLRPAALALADRRLGRAAADGHGRGVLDEQRRRRAVDGRWPASCVLLVMLFGWFGTVIGESEARLYNKQVDMSFRWSMSWFIFSEVMFFAAFFGALFYVRNLSVPDLGSLDVEAAVAGITPRGWPTVGPVHQGAVHADGRDRHPAAQHDHPAHLGRHADARAPRAEGRATAARSSSGCSLTIALGFTFLGFQAYEYIHAYSELNLKLDDRRLRLDVLHADRLPRRCT